MVEAPSPSPAAPVASRTLSEADSKALLSAFGVPFVDERLVTTPDGAREAVSELGAPVVAKLCGDGVAHKTERGLVRLGLRDGDAAAAATAELLAAATPQDAATGVLIAPMVSGSRELIAGVATDAQFGPTILLGLGGVLAEAVADVSIRLAPIDPVDAEEMIEDLSCQALLGELRGEPAVDRSALVEVLLALSAAVESTPGLRSVDLNPLIVHEGRVVAVDALVEIAGATDGSGSPG